jgi:hypothetical protein
MHAMTWATVGLLAATAVVGAVEPQAWKLNRDNLGKLPAGWVGEKTGTGEGSVWKVVADETAPSKSGLVLAQTAAGPSALFNLCVVQDGYYKDVELRVNFKAVKGDKDQGGGFVWRYQDAKNYYVARFNPLEDNYRLYHVAAGKRTQLVTKEEIKVATGTWHALSVKHIGDKIECYLDGKRQIEATDTTIPKPGKVGVWTKADAQTYFDGFEVTNLTK